MGVAFASLGLAPAAALACGASPEAYWTVRDFLTDSGTVAVDGAFVVTGKSWTDVYPDRGSGEFAQTVRVDVNDDAGVVVQGITDAWWSSHGAAVAWRPASALVPGARYQAVVRTASLVSRPQGADGVDVLRAEFRASEGRAPQLKLSGALQVGIESYDQPRFKDCICGQCSTPDGTVRALRARITIPAVDGGSAPGGYAAWVWLSDDVAHELPDGRGGSLVNLGGIERLPRGRATEVVRDIPAEDRAYAPCISVRVMDAADHHVDAMSICLAPLDVAATIAAGDQIAAGRDADAAKLAAPGGCSFAPAARPWEAYGSIAAVWLLLLAGGRRTGRQRPAPTRNRR